MCRQGGLTVTDFTAKIVIAEDRIVDAERWARHNDPSCLEVGIAFSGDYLPGVMLDKQDTNESSCAVQDWIFMGLSHTMKKSPLMVRVNYSLCVPRLLSRLAVGGDGITVIYTPTGEAVEWAHVIPAGRRVVLKRYKDKGVE